MSRADLPCSCWQGVSSHTYAADCPQHGDLAPRPAAPPAEAGDELPEVLSHLVGRAVKLWDGHEGLLHIDSATEIAAGLTTALQRLVAEAAEAARLRAVVEALAERWESSGRHYAKRADEAQTKSAELIYRLSGASLTEQAEALRRALDGDRA